MKHSLKDYSLDITEQAYHEHPAWSYSTIAKYARGGFSAMATLHDKVKTTPEMEFGTLFDSFITKGRKTLEEYAMVDFTVPPAEKAVLETLAANCTCPEFGGISMNEVIMTSDAVKYQPKWGPEARYKHIAEYGKYYDILKSGKKLVSKDDWNDAMEMYNVFRNDPYLKGVFGTKDTDDVEYIYQAKFLFYSEVNGQKVKVKFMPDLMIVNHKDKTIRLVDLKTSSMPAYDWPEHFIKMRYDIQGELYTEGIKTIIADDEEYKDYTVLPYLFTDISRVDKVPVTYEIDLECGFCFVRGEKAYNYKGWKELLGEILAYEAADAKVPNWIVKEGPNDLVTILGR